jgi:hypothetical protein
LGRSTTGATLALGSGAGHRGDFVGADQQHRVRAGELDGKLVDVVVLAAEAGGQGQGHGPGTGIDRAAEQRREVHARLGDEGDPVVLLHAARDQGMGHGDRVGAQFAIGIDAREGATRIVEIEAAPARGGIIQGIAESGEIGEDTLQRVFVGGRYKCLTRIRHHADGVAHVL